MPNLLNTLMGFLLELRLRYLCHRIGLGLVTAFFACTVLAHPHSWVEMKTYIQGRDGMITGFKMEWTFDPMTSAYMLDGEGMSSNYAQKTLRKLAASVLDNMLYEHYFTYFYDGDTPVKYSVAHSEKLTRNRAKLMLSFELPLSKPQPVTSDSLRLLIFDRSYYVDMAWTSVSDIQLSDELSRQCRLSLAQPNPTPEQVSYAMSLPADADPDYALGQLFTQTVNLHCTSAP